MAACKGLSPYVVDILRQMDCDRKLLPLLLQAVLPVSKLASSCIVSSAAES